MVARLVGLLLLPLFTAYLTPSDYGVLTILALLGFVIQPVFSLGLGAGMGPCYFEGNEERKSTTIWTAFAIVTASGLLLACLSLALSEGLSARIFASTDQAEVINLTLLGIALNMFGIPFMQRLQFENRALLFVTLTLISTLVTLIVSIVLVARFLLGVRGVVLGQLVGYLVGTVTAIAYARGGLEFRITRAVCKELLRLSLPLVPGFVFLLILMHGNKYVLQELHGLADAGIYGVGFNLGMASAVLVGALQTAWYPFFMSYVTRQDEARTAFGQVFTYYALGVGAVVLLFFLFAEPTVHLLTQSAFHDSYRVIGLVAAAQYFAGMFSLLLPALYFARNVAVVSVVQGLAALVAIGLSYLLIPAFSYFGAAIALCLATAVMVGILFAWQKVQRDRYLAVCYEWSRLARFFFFFLACTVLLLLPHEFSWGSQLIVIPVALVVILAGTYFCLSVAERSVINDFILRGWPRKRTQSTIHD
jgi:O-antigen/teichoic acid export membrane protein